MDDAIPSSFNSGMTNSFQKTVPSKNTATATASATPSVKPIKQPTSFSKPTTATPPGATPPAATQPNQITTNGKQQPNTAPPAPTAQAPTNLTKPTMSFNMKALAPWLGTAVAVGAGAYNAYQNSPLPMLSGLRNYLKVPQNMAGILGSLAPIASPLIRTAGLPLMFGAYSMLNDPNYLNDLTAGKIPKLAAVMPPIKPAAPAAPVSAPAAAPFVLPDFSSDTSSTFGNITSLNAPRPTGPTISLNAPDPERQAAVENLVRSGTGLANLAGQSAIHRAVKNPVIKGRASGALGAAVNIAELANVPERIAGTAQRPVSDILQSWQESMIDVPSWLNRHHQIQADPKASTGEKALSHVGNAISSPFVSVLTNRLNPVMNAGMAAKGIDDWTGLTNAIHGVSGGTFGTAPTGKTMSVPAAAGTMLQLSYGTPNKPLVPKYR